MVFYREKMVDRDALYLINVMSFKFSQLQHRPITVDLIFYAPKEANLGF